MSETDISQTLLPWTKELFASLMQRYQSQQLAHAILISGREGLGKRALATQLCASLLCPQVQGGAAACGQCKSCQLLAADSHPDALVVAAEKSGGAILIDQIRHINQFASLKSQLGGVQVVVIENAGRMNRNAANALLKTLEEPNDNLFMILLADSVQGLLPTIRSRCQSYRIGEPDSETQLQWLRAQAPGQSDAQRREALAMAFGAPMLAARLLQDDMATTHQQFLQLFLALSAARLDAEETASAWNNSDLGRHGDADSPLFWLYTWVSDLIRLKSGQSLADKYQGDTQATLLNLARGLDIDHLFDYYEQLIDALRIRHSQVNQQLLTEQLLIAWQSVCAGRPLRGLAYMP